MKETNYWKQFMMTGSVEDYLHYRFFTEEHSSNAVGSGKGQDGDTHAGLRGSDRDRTQDGSDRRIR